MNFYTFVGPDPSSDSDGWTVVIKAFSLADAFGLLELHFKDIQRLDLFDRKNVGVDNILEDVDESFLVYTDVEHHE